MIADTISHEFLHHILWKIGHADVDLDTNAVTAGIDKIVESRCAFFMLEAGI